MSAPRRPLVQRWFPNHEWVLLLLLAVEIGLFSLFGERFATRENFFEIARRGVELGLLSLGLTMVIITGGIDLSVGSALGLCAVVFGALCLGAGWPPGLAALVTLALGGLLGGANAALVTRLRIPPLIVTLGTYSLYRGLAEGLTGGSLNYTGFSPGFLALGQGYWLGIIPVQLGLFVPVIIVCWLALSRTPAGRGLYAVGCSPEGARCAGLPTQRLIAGVYVVSGLLAALAAIVYVARLGQAKADAGLGYELMAITAVVLGGTSIFGGRGTVGGTLLGLVAIVVLENGLRLSGQPAELAAILVGLLLLSAIAGGRLVERAGRPVAAADAEEELEMKNSQVTALCVVIVAAGLLVTGGLFRLSGAIETLGQGVAPAPVAGRPVADAPPPPAAKLKVAMMPKGKGDPYFISCKEGADKAAAELGLELIWDGPTDTDPLKQTEVVTDWIVQGVDVIAVSVANQEAISPELRRAREKGIKVLTWDADAAKDARDFLINQATPQGIGETLADEAGRILGGQGQFAIITDTLTAANQNAWIEHIKARLAEKYPGLSIAVTKPSENDRGKAYTAAQDILKAYPEVKLIMAISAPAVPGAAEAVQHAGRGDVKVIGLSLPSLCRKFIHDGVIDCIVLWKTADLGYLTVHAARALADGTLKPGVTSLEAGDLGTIDVAGDEVLLGKPFVFTKENVDQFDF